MNLGTEFQSPWQSALYVRRVQWTRKLLRPFGSLEQQYIDRLTSAQNRRVLRHLAGRRPEKALLIMPRCVKQTGCKADVQNSLAGCRECRACPLGDVARLCERYSIRALVAFRSHIAFELARKNDPDVIIATACHDRLVKALRSVPEYPALLAPLTGMERRCINAGVDIVWLERQLATLTGRAPTATPSPAATTAADGLQQLSPRTDCPAARAAEGR